MRREINMNYRQLRVFACVYVALPMGVFAVGFLRWYYAAVCLAALAAGTLWVLRSDNIIQDRGGPTPVRVGTVAGLFAFALIWSYLGGQNGYFYQSSDWNCRNAIFHDLIQQPWPVIYESTGAALVYYIGHWLPPAVIGKLVLWLTGSFRWAWFLGKMALWCWTSLGLTIVMLLLIQFLRLGKLKRQLLAVGIFVVFSGLDVLGALRNENLAQLLAPDTLHLEWWSRYQFSSITTCLFWVFNQAVVPWILTLCFLMETSPRNYVFYCTACLLCGPFPCVGLAICMVIRAGCYSVGLARKGKWKQIAGDVFSAGNVVSLLFVFPFTAAYILANNAVGATGSAQIALTQSPFFSAEYWDKELIQFLILEVGCYLALVFPRRRRDPLYYGLILIFVICPYFHVGASQDFCMRVSIPAVLILLVYTAEALLCPMPELNRRSVMRRVWACLLTGCLLIGAVTPAVEVYRGFYHVITQGTIKLEDKRSITFDDGNVYLNFNATDPESQFFFRYFSK